MCVCVFFLSILDIKFVGRTAGVTQEEGHTGFLIHLPSAVRALIFVEGFSHSLPSSISRILCTNKLIVLHPLGIFILVF